MSYHICLLLFVLLFHSVNGADNGESAALRELVILEKTNMKPLEKSAVSWIKPRLSRISPKVLSALNKRATLVHHAITFDREECFFLIDNEGSEWNGRWAVVMTGVTPDNFKVRYYLYVELLHEEIILSSSDSLGFNVGLNPVLLVKAQKKNERFSFMPSHLSDAENELMQGIWAPKGLVDVNIVNEIFSLDNKWSDEKTIALAIEIHSDHSCQIVRPHDQIGGNFDIGKVTVIEDENFGRYLPLLKVNMHFDDKKIEDTAFITILGDSALLMRKGKEKLLLRKDIKRPRFEFYNLNNLKTNGVKAEWQSL